MPNNPDTTNGELQSGQTDDSDIQELEPESFEIIDPVDADESGQLLVDKGQTADGIRTAIENTVEPTVNIVKFSTPKIYSPNHTPISQRIIQCETPSGCRITAASDKGINYKDINEDCIYVDPGKNLAVVIDGIGGGTKGRFAAQWVAVGFADYPDDPEQAAKAAMEYMKRDKIDPNTDGACFASARIINDGNRKIVDMAKAGDVKILILDENDKIIWHSKDNTYVQSEVDAGRMTLDQELYSEHSSSINKYISSSSSSIERLATEIIPGHKILLGSDGYFANLTPEEIEELIAGKGYTADRIITVLSNVVFERMQNFEEILANTKLIDGREQFGMFADGFLKTPNPDNRSMAIIEI